MKTMKKMLSLLLIGSLTFSLFMGCGTKQKENETVQKPDQEEQNNQGNQESQEGQKSPNESSASTEGSFPLPEKKELSFWITWNSEYKDDPNEIAAVQMAEEATNVHINYTTVNSAEAREKFGLMMASGDYPDILRGAESYYTGGLSKAVEDGVIYDLTEAVPQYMPHYQALRTSIPSLEKDTLTDDGRMIACYTIASKNGEISGELPWDGLALRQDWLNEQNLDVPTTIEDWHEVLTVFKEKYQCEAPLMIGSDNAYDYCNNFLSAYGVLGAFYQVDNVVHFGPLEEGYRKWVELFRQWYSEGLIDQNFVTNDASMMTSFDYLGTGKADAGSQLWGFTADYMKQAGYNQDENFFLVGATAPVLNEGDTPQLGTMMSALTKETLSITTNCKDLELACRWLDYAYTEESMFAYSYGIEGESYVQNEDGSYSLTDAFYQMQKDENYPTAQDAMYNTYTLGNAAYGLYNWDMYTPLYAGSRATEAYEPWSKGQYDLVLPVNMTMIDEETNRYNTLYTAIETLVQENTVKYITGAQDMSNYDQFVADLYTYGIEECIACKQAALDRYLAR